MKTTKSTRELRKPAGLTEAALRELMGTGAVTAVHAVAQEGLYVIQVDVGTTKARLLNSRGGVRTFRSLDTVATTVRVLGATEFQIHLTPTKKK